MVELIAGAQAWSSYAPGSMSDTGVLVLHGFTGNPVSLRPLAESLAAEGFAVELPLLPGHGTTWKDMQRTTWRDWAGEAAAALDRLRAASRARVAIGLSMGGTLALHLAQTRGADLAGLALVNPSVHSADTRLRAVPVAKYLVPSAASIGNDIARPGGDERAYPRVPLRALASVLQFQRRVRADLGRVQVPTLVFTSRADHVVHPSNSTMVLEGITAADREQVWLERSYHVATLDYDAELIAERTAAFVRRVGAAAPVTIRFELFAAGPARPEDVWALVGDLQRLPEWTDAERVEVRGDRPDEAGGAVTTTEGDRRLEWLVTTRERRLVELSTTLGQGRLGLGVRVLPDPLGSRVVLACAFEPASRAAGLRFRLVGAPALRGRFDRWASAAVRSAPGT